MGVRFLIDDGSDWPIGCLFDSVTETAFGPLFPGHRTMTRGEVFEWMDRTLAAIGRDARLASFSEIREARDRTRDVAETQEIGGEG